jgi:hypothetical protein
MAVKVSRLLVEAVEFYQRSHPTAAWRCGIVPVDETGGLLLEIAAAQ